MGSRIGILAGGRGFARVVLQAAARRGETCVVAAAGLVAEPLDLDGTVEAFRAFETLDLAGALAFFREHGADRLVLAGQVDPRVLFAPGLMDGLSRDLLGQVAARNPSAVLKFLLGYLAHKGFQVLDPTPYLADAFCRPGRLTRTEPSAAAARDIGWAWPKARLLADEDIGQTLVVKSGQVVAVEGAEGTDAAVARGGELAGPGTVVVKVARTRQDPRVDLPAVGLETVLGLVRAGAAALGFEAARMPFFDRVEATARADEAGLAIVAL